MVGQTELKALLCCILSFFSRTQEEVQGGSICFILFIISINLYLLKELEKVLRYDGTSSLDCSSSLMATVDLLSLLFIKTIFQFVLISSSSTSLIFRSFFLFCSLGTDSPEVFINPSTPSPLHISPQPVLAPLTP